MGKILAYYTKYLQSVPDYKKWEKDSEQKPKTQQLPDFKLQQKAKTIAEPLLLVDKYEHTKAEDSETFFQTLNIELMSIAGVISALPVTVTKLIPFLEKRADKNSIAKTSAELLKKYSAKTIGNKNIPLSKALTVAATVAAGLFYAKGIRKSMNSQLGMIRKASFDASQNIINDPKLFAVLNSEQEQQLQELLPATKKKNNAVAEQIKDKLNIGSSFEAVGEYKKTQKKYSEQKREYNKKIENKSNKNVPLSSSAKLEAEENKLLLQSMLKNVEHDVLEPLRKVETIANIAYASLFTGGLLEYLISDKIVDIMGIKNKAVKAAAKVGVPLVSYMLLNKNISDIENKVILATKYKHLKKFVENPNEINASENKKQSLPQFIKEVIQDTKDYNKFSETELPLLEEKLNAKKKLKFSQAQLEEAKLLQENTAMAINKHRENVFGQTVGIKSLAETILGPLDIVVTAVGAKLGHTLAKKNPKLKGLFMGIGAVAAFIPAAVVEAILTKQQKLAEKTAAMLAIKETDNTRLFANIPDEKYNLDFEKTKKPEIFKQI